MTLTFSNDSFGHSYQPTIQLNNAAKNFNSAELSASIPTSETIVPIRGRVLHLINGEHYSGAEKVQDLLGLNLPKVGYDLEFACVKAARFPKQRVSQNIPLTEIRMRNKLDFWAYRQVVALAKKSHFDIIHAHTPRSAMIGSMAAKALRIPFVFHVHSPTSRDSTRPIANWFNHNIEMWSVRRADALIGVSGTMKTHMIEFGCPEEKIYVVPNGVPKRERLENRPTPTGTWTVGTVALFRQRKGTEILIDAVKLLTDRGHDVRIRAVGEFETKEYEKLLKDRVTQHRLEGRVDWTGFCSNVSAELDQMDLFALPSLFGEGMPMVVLEAMASGLPVISTKVEGVPEVIRHGVEGLLAEPGNAADLADQIEAIIVGKLDWQKARFAAIQRHTCHYSDDAMARGVAAVYDKVIKNRSSS